MGMYTIEFILKLIVDGAKKYFTTGWNLFDISLLVDMYFQLLNRKYSLILFPVNKINGSLLIDCIMQFAYS